MSEDKEETRRSEPEFQRYEDGTRDLSVDSKLNSALRIHTSELMNRLSLDDTKNLAYVMWSSENIDDREYDEITACNTSSIAVITLLRHVRTRGDTAIIGFAKALGVIERRELAEKILPAAAYNSSTLFDHSTDGELRSNFRKLTPKLCSSLTLRHVHDLAHRMWSAKNLNGIELERITSCTENFAAVARLTDYVYARGGASIISLAKALNDIEMPDLASKICPAVATTVVALTQAYNSCLDNHAEAATAGTSLSRNLRHYSVDIAQRLTDGEIDGIIAVLRSTKERYLTDLEYEKLKVIKGASTKAMSLINTLVKKGDGAVQLFAKALKDFGRQELLNKVL